MEESTCHKMVIVLLKRFSCMKCFFFCTFSLVLNIILTLTLESMIARAQEMSEDLSIIIDHMINHKCSTQPLFLH